MPVRDLFSKRQKRLRGETRDVFTYSELPQPLRVQIVHIWDDAIGETNYSEFTDGPTYLFLKVEKALLREYGLKKLVRDRSGNTQGARDAVERFFLNCSLVDECLDVVELVFYEIENFIPTRWGMFRKIVQRPNEAVQELNYRFKEHGIGFEYREGEIIRVDSQLVHAEVALPALKFLAEEFLAGANDEFMTAHEHYRHSRYKECLVECCKAFESTMKSICDKRKWVYSKKATAKDLIEVCITNSLFPQFLDSHLTGLRTTLESGLPTVRNKLAGHGQGSTLIEVPEEVASYALHLAATNILLLASSEAKLP